MSLFLQKYIFYFTASLLLISMPYAIAMPTSAWEEKKFTPKERKIEEERIRKSIIENADMRYYSFMTYDFADKNHRWLYSDVNQSILLHQTTGERFGIYESFIDDDNTIKFEIRLHKNSKLTARYALNSSSGVKCRLLGLSAEEVTEKYILYKRTCLRQGLPNDITHYLYNYASNGFYRITVGSKEGADRISVSLKNGIYSVFQEINSAKNCGNINPPFNFKFEKDSRGGWDIKTLPPINNYQNFITPLEKLPNKPEYDLPDFVIQWGKK